MDKGICASRCPYLFSGQTILKVHLYAPDLEEIIPNSEKRASDSGQTIPTSENLPSDSGQTSTP